MRTMIAAACTALALAAGSHAAGAQTLVSADNPGFTTFTTDVNGPWILNGVTTQQLNFTTTKANEAVELNFSGFCGIKQASADGSGGAQGTSLVQIFFTVDGKYLGEQGSANVLCYDMRTPMPSGAVTGAGSIAQQRYSVATPGLHTVAVVVQSQRSVNGTNLVPVLGQTHFSVSR